MFLVYRYANCVSLLTVLVRRAIVFQWNQNNSFWQDSFMLFSIYNHSVCIIDDNVVFLFVFVSWELAFAVISKVAWTSIAILDRKERFQRYTCTSAFIGCCLKVYSHLPDCIYGVDVCFCIVVNKEVGFRHEKKDKQSSCLLLRYSHSESQTSS